MTEIEEHLECTSYTRATSIERIAIPYSCYCMDEDVLRKILEPDKY
jgi:hypothetical protein